MSFYINMFVPPKSGVESYLWKINRHGEIVVELLSEDAPVCDSSRGMVVMGSVDDPMFYFNLTRMLEKAGSQFALVSRAGLHKFNVSSLEELVEKLNSPRTSKAKTLWNGLPWQIRPLGIEYKGNKYRCELEAIQ